MKFYFGILSLFFTIILNAQTTNLARLEYTYFPQKQSENSFRRLRAFVQLPIKINGTDDYLVPGLEYRSVNLKYNDSAPFQTQNLEDFQSFEAKLGYIKKINESWRVAGEAGIIAASNFSSNQLQSSDLLFTGSIYGILQKKLDDIKKYRLLFGLNYSTSAGFPFPLPVVMYNKTINLSWSYNIGVPKSNIKYVFNDKHTLQLFVTLDGFYANVQDDINLSNSLDAKEISMRVVLAGLGYEYYFTEHLLFFSYVGYTLGNDIRLRDRNKNTVYTINNSNSFYARGGLKFKL